MTVPTIFETCRPRADVLEGAIAEAYFAADLAQVIVGKGNAEYLDPTRFFANTYPTRGLRNLLANMCRRVTGAGGEAASIFRLDTSYGGGKSHGLIALCHAARGARDVPGIGEFVDPSLLPRSGVRIAAFDGENADPANGRRMEDGLLAYTPWGEIVCALAGRDGYERVRKSDESRIAAFDGETLREPAFTIRHKVGLERGQHEAWLCADGRLGADAGAALPRACADAKPRKHAGGGRGHRGMGREEAAYWLGMAMHRNYPRRVLTALRCLLTEPKR